MENQSQEYKKKDIEKLCIKQNHNFLVIQSICFQQQCFENRLLCSNCYYDHRFHKISTLNGGDYDIIRFLQLNQNIENSQNFQQYFKDHYQRINKQFQMIHKIIDNYQKKFEDIIKYEWQAIWRSFNSNSTKQTINEIKEKCIGENNYERLQYITKMLNFLLNKFQPRNKKQIINLKQIAQQQYSNICSIFGQSFSQIQQILQGTIIKIKQHTVENIKSKNSHLEYVNMPKIQQRNYQQVAQPLRISKQHNGIFSFFDLSNRQRQSVQSQASQKPSQKNYNEKYIIERSYHQKQYKQNEKIIIQSNSFQQIQKILNKYKQSLKIKEVQIIPNSMHTSINKNIMMTLCTFTNLQKLKIRWCRDMPLNYIQRLLKCLRNLQQICFQNCNKFEQQSVDIIKTKFKQIKKLCYGIDYRYSLPMDIFSNYFMNHYRSQSLGHTETFELSKLQNLTNIWIGKLNSLSDRIIHNMADRLTQLQLGQFVGNKKILSSKFIKGLEQIKYIEILILNRIINCDQLTQFISKSKYLYSLVFSECQNIGDQLITQVSQNCKMLNQLSLLQYNKELDITKIWLMKELKTLILNVHLPIQKKYLINGLSDLTKLEFLDLHSNKWIDDDNLDQIASLNNLIFLSLQGTKIGDKSLQKLSNLNKLQSFMCGATKINGKALIKMIKKIKNIKHLSISWLDGNDDCGFISENEIIQISKNLELTHLSIYNNKHIGDKIIPWLMKSLQCIAIYNTNISKQCQKEMIEKGVWVCKDQ